MKKTKKRLRFRGFLIILLAIYLMGVVLAKIITMPVKSIEVKGITLLKSTEVLKKANIDNYPNFLRVSTNSIKKKLIKEPLIKDVSVKKTITGRIVIDITESKVLFYNANSRKIVLDSKQEEDYKDIFLGVPILINYTPDTIYDELINKLSLVDQSIISKISEIEYSPHEKDGTILDPERFILKMNDKNTVHINLLNIKKLDKYNEIYEILENSGTLYLDSSSKNYIFKAYNDQL